MVIRLVIIGVNHHMCVPQLRAQMYGILVRTKELMTLSVTVSLPGDLRFDSAAWTQRKHTAINVIKNTHSEC